ncbi:MAG TPA: hypothetical protein VLG12_04870 [Candidatus Saccharimonadales bacterium]|nr:hypothetical protein [Candidatus Saccharimonadales bacterium]
MKTQQTYNNRHHWLAVKQTIGINTAPSFLNHGCEPSFTRNINRKHDFQETYYIDILGILNKFSIFFKGFTSLFAFSFQTEWNQSTKQSSSKALKSI